MTKQYLDLFFDPGETVCVSPDKYGYHSVAQSDMDGPITLYSPNAKVKPKTITESDILLMGINPIKGFRQDKNVTTFRTFMVEIDDGTLASQKEYIEESGLPWSVCVYSGNKSLHYGIVLKQDLPLSFWKPYAQWIVNILERADQQVKNPSRSIRFPGNKRHDGEAKMQSLIEMRDRIELNDLILWLDKHKDKKPESPPIRPYRGLLDRGWRTIPWKVEDRLQAPIEDSRNSTWFWMACCMADKGYDEEDTIDEFERFFEEDGDFTRKEWESCIKSAFRHIG